MGKEFIVHNGVKMTEDWPAKIQAAQLLTHYTIAGQKYPRISFGDEGHPGWGQKPCLDCGVLKGQFHVPDCEYEKCPACGEGRAGGCQCDTEELREPGEDPVLTSGTTQRGSRNFTRACWIFVIVCLLLLVRSILMLFGI